ncbi:hypothetical protein [Sinorhizobium medicae]|uniref:hypothetical protein n=1 Tax=Sinorhizobium medicae TaxID=110321 RepID=UPI00119C051D|nr:hypothetical protein [Sinorhizobium medicae]TWA16097.1 hypothetical protein FB006_1265 [Sinorhizobium medicae]TWA36154.1 hypothetical protein FB005_12645 [Sinorhizobium medicae]UFX05414.1 hypothetical protein SmedWSM1115_23570 [Sinorhizobium medicae WSM1115]WQO62516.1 hypothetical protein U8C35_33970 [Sinorhizobium medicae]WQO89003.1 hypothetical protein U8C37_31335 [Sinorhizobium medicae]
MAIFEVLADQELARELGVPVVMLTRDEGRDRPRKGIMLTRELVEDAFEGDRERAAEAARSGVIDQEAMRRIDSPDRLIYQSRGEADQAAWVLAAFTRDDLGLFEGPVRSGGAGAGGITA